MNNITFQTQGEWETSVVTNLGQQIDCMAIKLHLQSNSFTDVDLGGTLEGVDILDATILVPNSPLAIDEINRFIDQGMLDNAYTYCTEQEIFPGEITIVNPSGQQLQVAFNDPLLVTNNIRVFLDGVEITSDICEVYCDINYIENVVQCNVTYTTSRGVFSHTNEQIELL